MEQPKQIRPEWVPEAYKEIVKPGKLKREKIEQVTNAVGDKSKQNDIQK